VTNWLPPSPALATYWNSEDFNRASGEEQRREQGYPQKESVLWPHHLSSLTPKTFLPYTKEQWGCQALPILSIEGLISCPR